MCPVGRPGACGEFSKDPSGGQSADILQQAKSKGKHGYIDRITENDETTPMRRKAEPPFLPVFFCHAAPAIGG